LLPLVGPSVIAALLVMSVLPEVFGFGAGLARHAVALLITLAVALKYGNLGLTLLAGVLACGLVSLAM
jgi:branched-subunit amino acid transport protein